MGGVISCQVVIESKRVIEIELKTLIDGFCKLVERALFGDFEHPVRESPDHTIEIALDYFHDEYAFSWFCHASSHKGDLTPHKEWDSTNGCQLDYLSIDFTIFFRTWTVGGVIKGDRGK